MWRFHGALRATYSSYSAGGLGGEDVPVPSSQRLLYAVVDSAEQACAKGWLQESILTHARSHAQAREQDVEEFATSFFRALHSRRREPLPRLDEESFTALQRPMRVLYGLDSNCGE